MQFEESIKQIYSHIGDEYSKRMYENRLLYSLTGDNSYLKRVVGMTPEGAAFLRMLDNTETVFLFGAGAWGKELIASYPEIQVGGCIDNKFHGKEEGKYLGYKVYSFDRYVREFSSKSVILIASRLFHKEMYSQLIEAGVPESSIINAGKMIDEMSDRQYFDNSEINNSLVKEECFVDAGAFDGKTSRLFFDMVLKDSDASQIIACRSYMFEPDEDNANKCMDNLDRYVQSLPTEDKSKCSYEVIPRGLWSEETVLSFSSSSNGASKVDDSGIETIKVGKLDEILKDKRVSFIKMDLEGSEYHALVGAEETIKQQKPKLAISLYHKPEDVWVLPQLILDYRNDYTFYLGHYSVAAAETVLYAL
ncbi:methyltransferase, FkbM family [Lachnospiraceae bacterium XBB2008]|nr:methyltransferase, FkbM family [Lachnospiraceae bacterium XBB2008]